MTTFTIEQSPPYHDGQRITVYAQHSYYGVIWRATILRVSDHELLVRVGGWALAFQRHDGESWSWTQWRQGEMGMGDEDGQGRLV